MSEREQTADQVRANIDYARPMPRVARRCKRCHDLTWTDIATGNIVVSPRGIAHHGNNSGETDCGIDATGDKWWWPL